MGKSIFNLHKNLQKDKIKKYYLGKLYQGQAAYTRWLNFFFYRLVVFLGAFFFFLLYSQGKMVLISFLSGISVLLIYHYLAQKIEKRQLANVIAEENAQLAYGEFRRRLKGLDKDGFTAFIGEILSSLPQFSQLERTEHLESEGVDFICKYQGELTLIQCHLLDGEEAVESRNARKLSRAMSKRKYSQGIIISTTDFRKDTEIFCDLVKEKRKIQLWNEKKLVEMVKASGNYPKEEEIKDLLLKHLEHQERKWPQTGEKILGKTRIIPNVFYGCFLIFLSNFTLPSFRYLYYGGAFLLFILSLVGFIMGKNKVKKYPDLLQ